MENEIREILSELAPNKIGKLYIKRLWFGIGLMACASFLLMLSFVFPETDKWWWIGSGLVLLGVGAFFLDRARRALTNDPP